MEDSEGDLIPDLSKKPRGIPLPDGYRQPMEE
jgi:hypothetical protein